MSARFESFMRRLRSSQELAVFGFNELAAHERPEDFFDDLLRSGFFSAGENPVPIEDPDQKGFFRIPFWPALPYLLAVAKRARDLPNPELGSRVLRVVREVTTESAEAQRRRDNYHTNRLFAEILGVVPLSLVSQEFIDLVPLWLDSRFGNALVSEALSKGVLSRLLESELPERRSLALGVLDYCTKLTTRPSAGPGGDSQKVLPVIEEYWLRTLLLRHAKVLGRELGAGSTAIFSDRLRVVFGFGVNRHFSTVTRPSIGDHEQNHNWELTANAFVEALRDSTLEWVDTGDPDAKSFAGQLLESDALILRRIGLYIAKERGAALMNMFRPATIHFAVDVFHESYELLAQRWTEFSPEQQDASRASIEEVARTNAEDESEFLYRKAKWLRALEGKRLEWVERTLSEARAAGVFGPSEHPDFEMYHETRTGPGPSPYSRAALKAMALEGSLIARLNAFEGAESWKGSPTDALVQELEEAIAESPEDFVRVASDFRVARPEYFYAFLMAISRVLSADSKPLARGGEAAFWAELVDGIQERVCSIGFWEPFESRSWKGEAEAVTSAAMRILSAGARDDARGIPLDLVQRALEIIYFVLDRLTPASKLDDDPMHQAINSTRGKAIETLIALALLSCRNADQTDGGHAEAWARLRPIFDSELDKCLLGNLEFSTLLGSRLANFAYMNQEWVQARGLEVFSLDRMETRESALDGLAYGAASSVTYRLLRDGGVVLDGLRLPPRSRQARERMIESVGLAYLWEEEELAGESLDFLLRHGTEKDLVVLSHFYWAVERQGLEAPQVTRVLSLVRHTLALRDEGPGSIPELKRALGRLIGYVEDVDADAMNWLRIVVPEVARGVDLYEVAEEFLRLVERSPREVLELLGLALTSSEPDFDLDGHLVETARKLAKAGFRTETLVLLERMRRIAEAESLYNELRNSGGEPRAN